MSSLGEGRLSVSELLLTATGIKTKRHTVHFDGQVPFATHKRSASQRSPKQNIFYGSELVSCNALFNSEGLQAATVEILKRSVLGFLQAEGEEVHFSTLWCQKLTWEKSRTNHGLDSL